VVEVTASDQTGGQFARHGFYLLGGQAPKDAAFLYAPTRWYVRTLDSSEATLYASLDDAIAQVRKRSRITRTRSRAAATTAKCNCILTQLPIRQKESVYELRYPVIMCSTFDHFFYTSIETPGDLTHYRSGSVDLFIISSRARLRVCTGQWREDSRIFSC
jgi:hypothetical protein